MHHGSVPVLGASGSLEATVAVFDAATPLDDIPREKNESGSQTSDSVGVETTLEKAGQEASNQVAPPRSETPFSSRVVIPNYLRKSKKNPLTTYKSQEINNTSETSSEDPHRGNKKKDKIKLQKSSFH